MNIGSFEFCDNKIIIKIRKRICETPEELLSSRLFKEVLKRACRELEKRNSQLLGIFRTKKITDKEIQLLIETLSFLTKMSGDLVPNVLKGSGTFLKDRGLFNAFIEYLYDYWRGFERIIICDSTGDHLDKRPFRTFNSTIGQLTALVRGVYRDIEENITGRGLRVYRQVQAGAEIATISLPMDIPLPAALPYHQLSRVPVVRQIMLNPPLILNPPMNKRTGRFERVAKNPLDHVQLKPEDWICYPAKVGKLVVLVYFHKMFFELGFSLCNLFALADDEDLKKKPDAVYLYGVPKKSLSGFDCFPTVFFEDDANGILVGAVPGLPEFGYFGYLKKMVLTLHNIKTMREGRMPFHGALLEIILKGGKRATLLFMGDTGAGKSETIEAFRDLGGSLIQDMNIIADDMGSLEIGPRGDIIGYGTEIGAFLRLDDLRPDYALGQMDRAIIMSANQVNARITLPVTTLETVIKGHAIDYIFYANNYEEIDEDHPIIERLGTADHAFATFREGTVMSKGTTTTTGIVHTYFANVFGPPQCRELHEKIATKYFRAFFKKKLFVGQIRTRLGIAGWERRGPEEAAKALLKMLA